MARYNERGEEVPDSIPVALPAGFQRPEPLSAQIQRLIRTEISRQAEEAGEESFEEADDFEVDEDPDPLSPYELREAAPEWPGGNKDEDAAPPPPPEKKTPVEAPEQPEGAS